LLLVTHMDGPNTTTLVVEDMYEFMQPTLILVLLWTVAAADEICYAQQQIDSGLDCLLLIISAGGHCTATNGDTEVNN
jgi:hypothetical protein